MTTHRRTPSGHALATFMVTTALSWTVGMHAAWAAPIKVACIGEHTTHSHAFPPGNRETQPVGMQEYPAQLQTLLGPGYDVRNFGDCCATVLQGYTVAETHPFVAGTNPGDGVGYKESIAFLPDIVIIGSWGRHDWGLNKAPTQVFTLAGFQQGYDDLIKRYQALSSHPQIFVSYPIPILFGQGEVADQGVTTKSVLPTIDAIATKYNLPIIDLYQPFFGHKELFKQTGTEGEGEHVADPGLTVIAKAVFAVMKTALAQDGGTDASSGGAMDASSGSGGATLVGDAAPGSGGSGGSAVVGGTGGQGTSGSQAGSAVVQQTGGASGGTAAPAAAPDSGCSCSLASQPSSTSRTAAFALAGVALVLRRRRRARGTSLADSRPL